MVIYLNYNGGKLKRIDELHGAIVLSEKEIKQILEEIGWRRIIDAIAETFTEEAKGNTVSPPKVIINMLDYNNDFRIMPSRMLKYPDYCGSKIVGACIDNPSKYNLPLVMGLYTLFHAPSMKTLMICDCTELTAWRTAAATAVAVETLSKKNVETLGIIGCGKQAYYHIPAIKTVRSNIEKIFIFDKKRESMKKLAKAFPSENMIPSFKEELFDKCDVIVTITPTTLPHIFPKDIPDRELLLCGVGGDAKHKIEIDPNVLSLANTYCDSFDQVAHTGTMEAAKKLNVITTLKSLGKHMLGFGHRCYNFSRKLTLFLSTGVALEDIATAILIYNHVKD